MIVVVPGTMVPSFKRYAGGLAIEHLERYRSGDVPQCFDFLCCYAFGFHLSDDIGSRRYPLEKSEAISEPRHCFSEFTVQGNGSGTGVA